MSERDPRIDPMAGDVVADDLGEFHVSLIGAYRTVIYSRKIGGEWLTGSRCFPLGSWRVLADGTTIIRRAEEQS